MDNRFNMLDEDQKKVVTSNANNILTIAGSGSGKTFALTERVRFLIEQGEDPAQIVAITFTNMAADEMQERLGKIPHLRVGTIHSLANQILQANGIPMETWLGQPRQFDKLLEMGTEYAHTMSVKHVLVDEYQDIGDREQNFIDALDAECRMYVGDDWQAIYGFKGGNIKFFFSLISNPRFEKYYLVNNYRSGANILGIAGKEISRVREKVNKTVRIMSDYPGTVEHTNIKDALQAIADSGDLKSWFFLTRTNDEIAQMEMLMMERWMPYVTFKKSDTTLDGMNIMLDSDCVKLLTIHSAKGLEADNVVVLGMRRWKDDEIRVNYVAMTRARRRLLIC